MVDETGSTNADLLRAVGEGAPDRSVLITRHQTAGRGRLDRRWDAPAGANLLMSVLFRADGADPHRLIQRLGVAARAVAAAAGVSAGLKWPNDLLVGTEKLAGILAEGRADPAGGLAVVVGIGMNVNWAPPGAARLAPGAVDAPPLEPLDPLRVAAAVLEAFDERDDDVALEGEYREHLATLGRRVRVELPSPDGEQRVVEGRAVDVDAAGHLVVLDDCAITHRFAAGDVVHVR
ncbi:MAG: biotin--[acetyl-CoA-carboxylase] ligase [Ilumatobacteraceae bacterium]